jgi:trk system potassium uptake protein TrkH
MTWWRRLALAFGRVSMWMVMAPPRASFRVWSRLRPPQQLVVGFVLYALAGGLLLCLPFTRERPAGFIDNLFTAVSAISTTGLTTINLSEHYSIIGEAIVLTLFQIGGIGFMTLSSIFVLTRGKSLSDAHVGVLKSGFSLPHYFVVHHFIVHVVVFTAICESAGTLLLWWRFEAAGVDRPLWSAVFHSVSAFATAGFSLNSDSLESLSGDTIVNLVVGALAYMGAIGFIVAQDVWYSAKLRERMLTFTSKVILSMTAGVFVFGTLMLFFTEQSVRGLPLTERLLACAFQTMTASTTAGFNTIPIGAMSAPALVVVMLVMLIGASPSGTGGGIKTTSVSAILGNLTSVLHGRSNVLWLGHEVPVARLHFAFAAASIYLIGLLVGVLALCLFETEGFLPIVFEAASAIGTVGLSMGLTGDLSVAGKITVIVLMLAGRAGPLTLGLALLRPGKANNEPRQDDLAV